MESVRDACSLFLISSDSRETPAHTWASETNMADRKRKQVTFSSSDSADWSVAAFLISTTPNKWLKHLWLHELLWRYERRRQPAEETAANYANDANRPGEAFLLFSVLDYKLFYFTFYKLAGQKLVIHIFSPIKPNNHELQPEVNSLRIC